MPGIIRRALAAGALAGVIATPAFADSTPIRPLPKGPVSTVSTHRGLLVTVALPRQAASKGLVWRLARPVDSRVLRQVGEADVGANVVILFSARGRGRVSVVFALTRGDSSPKAVRAVTNVVRVT